MRAYFKRHGRALRRSLAAVLALIVLSPVGARAASIVLAEAHNNSPGDYSQTGPRREFRSSAVTYDETLAGFCARYASVLAVDVAALGNTEAEAVTASYSLTFSVSADVGEQWILKVKSHRKGAYTIIDDNGRHGTAQLTTSISATSSTGHSMAVHQFGGGSETNSSNPGSNKIVPIDQGAPAESIIPGTGPLAITLTFSWGMNVISDPDGFPSGGDEAALRLGLSTIGINRITAGDYAALGDRVQDDDGHFVCVELCPAAKVNVTTAGFCAPLAGNPCTFTACGTVEGCVQNNYSVLLTYVDNVGTFITNAVISVTNGNTSWCGSVTVPGPCDGYPYQVYPLLIDSPGIRDEIGALELLAMSKLKSEPTTLAQLAPCGDIATSNSTTGWGRIGLGALILAVAGAGILRRGSAA